jgi:Metallopeptidase family M24
MSTSLAPADLDRHREVQQLAYQCCEEISAQLRPGMSEREVTRRMRRWLTEHGVTDVFHIPFAWFGDRTAFRGFRIPTQFLPSGRRLEEGMAYVLDCAPIVDGYTADIGYANRFGENPIFDRLFADLAEFRPFILERVRAGKTLKEIYQDVDALIVKLGYENRHKIYPGRVIGHTVTRVSRPPVLRRLPFNPVAVAFGVRALETLLRELAAERVKGRSPLWADGRISNHPAYPALWAVEPHIGFRGVGVKFEEILVVTDNDAFWLDDEPSHVQRWRQLGVA